MDKNDLQLGKQVQVTFGMPSLNCHRYGICRIEQHYDTPQYVEPLRPRTALATLKKGGEDSLIFCFHRASMLDTTAQKFFAGGHFLILENVFLPETLAADFGAKSVEILRGRYEVLMSPNGDFVVEISNFTIKTRLSFLVNHFFQSSKHKINEKCI